jgi:hypothetical protein
MINGERPEGYSVMIGAAPSGPGSSPLGSKTVPGEK